MKLSIDSILIYILKHSGCTGRLTSGRIERRGAGGLHVYDFKDELIEYISGDRVRSWCVFDGAGSRSQEWCHIQSEDAAFF